MTKIRLDSVIKRKFITVVLIINIVITGMSSLMMISPQEAYATHCANPSQRCHALERNSVVSRGNMYTITVTNMNASCSNPNSPLFVLVTQWVALPNGDYLEWGTVSGALYNNFPTSTQWSCVNERSYRAGQVAGAYFEINVAATSIGSGYTYELSDINNDTIWIFYRGTTNYGQTDTAYSTSNGQEVGAEVNNTNPTLPNTHIHNIQLYSNQNARWERWLEGSYVEHAPLWVKNCATSPYGDHLHVGDTSILEQC